jgi:hypothetical protein
MTASAEIWTSANGKFSQEATFISLDGDDLQIQPKEGKALTVKLHSLDKVSQLQANKLASQSTVSSRPHEVLPI